MIEVTENVQEPFVQEPFLANACGDKYLYSVNRNTFAKQGAEEFYAEYFGEHFFQEDMFYLIVGTDCGILVNYLNRRGIPNASRVVFIELPSILERLPDVLDPEINENIKVCSIPELKEQFDSFRLVDYIFANRATLLKAVCVTDGFLADYSDLHVRIKTDFAEANFRTQANLGDRRFIVPQLAILGDNRISSTCLRGAFKGKSAILLAAGPSLEALIPWVKENRSRLVVLAVSRVSKTLLQHDLVPDIIYTLDPSDLSFDVSRESMCFADSSLLLHGKHSTPLITGQWRGRSVYLGPRFHWKTELNPPTLSIAGPTVTQGLLQAIVEMGFTRVYLVGVDLCFSREGHAYSASVSGHERGAVVGDIPGGVETNGGWRAGTLHPYLIGGSIMEKLARWAKQKGCQVINLAAGAMKLAGIDFLPPEDAEVTDEALRFNEMLSKVLPADERSDRIAHYKTMLAELDRARREILEIDRLAKMALEANRCLFDPARRKPQSYYRKRMDRCEKLIQGHKDFSGFLKRFGIMRFLKIVEPNREGWTPERMERTGRMYYNAYIFTIKDVLYQLVLSAKRLDARLTEEEDVPDFDTLVARWEPDRQYGRCLLWRDRNPEAFSRLTASQREQFDDLKTRYEKILAREEDMSPVPVNPKIDYRNLRARACMAFRQNNPDELEILAEGLRVQDNPSAAGLASLALGFRAELLNDNDEASYQYQKTIDSGEPALTEEALIRVAAIASEQQDDATLKLAFECLSTLSPNYMPKYAELLWLLGEHPQALDACADYLEKVPGDVSMMLRLAGYYRVLQMTEGVDLLVAEIRQRVPSHPGLGQFDSFCAN